VLARHHDPILAIATASGRAAVGIVRVSGRDLRPLVQALFGSSLTPRQAHYLPFTDAQGQRLEQGLALYFPAPHSFTGEDVLELQAHGGPVVLQLLLARCLEVAQTLSAEGQPCLPRLRLAQAGEFSERAFLNDKIDLVQAEHGCPPIKERLKQSLMALPSAGLRSMTASTRECAWRNSTNGSCGRQSHAETERAAGVLVSMRCAVLFSAAFPMLTTSFSIVICTAWFSRLLATCSLLTT